MIPPTIGRHVWIWRTQSIDTTQPEAGIIVGVNSQTSINVIGWTHRCYPFHLFDLHLEQDEARASSHPWPLAVWMPFQKGQAKTQGLESALTLDERLRVVERFVDTMYRPNIGAGG